MRAFANTRAVVVTMCLLAWPGVAAAALFDLTGTWSTGADKFKCKSRTESATGEIVKSSTVGTSTIVITQPTTTDGKVGPILHVAIGATVATMVRLRGTTNADTGYVAECTDTAPASASAMAITKIKLKPGGSGSFKATLTDESSVCIGVFTRTSSIDPAVPDCSDPCS